MKKIILSLSVISVLFAACGPDANLVASGAENSCKMKELAEQIKADPENLELKEDYLRSERRLADAIELAGEGNEEAMKAAINEAAKDCK